MEQSIDTYYDVLVIGGGPAGLAAAIAASDGGAGTLIIERELRIGGILKQCIHDGFGLVTFNEKLTGPEYAERYIHEVKIRNIKVSTATYVTDIVSDVEGFKVILVNASKGVFEVKAKALILATGCRERTSKQVFIAGTRPAGVYTAGTAQYFVNILGYLPCKRCVILGSGDIGLIMARRLKLEGAEVIGVFEAKSTPSGLARNLVQCLDDFNIPLELSHTVTRVFGEDRVNAVEISMVDENMVPVAGTERVIDCDGVILSVGLIPENELAENLGVKIDKNTKGPIVNESFMTSIPGIFSCGNALHVNDLVDYVTESGITAGIEAAKYSVGKQRKIGIDKTQNNDILDISETYMTVDTKDFLYIVPQIINEVSNVDNDEKTTIYFRSRYEERNVDIKLLYNDEIVFSKKYDKLKPPEMERLELRLSSLLKGRNVGGTFKLTLSRNK